MRRLRATLMTVAALVCLCAAPAAAEAAAPTVPTNVTATVLNDGAREATVDVAWSASTDPEGDAVSYEVLETVGDMINIKPSATNSLRILVNRGVDIRFDVVAVDATGARSARSATVIVTAPPIPVRLVFGVSQRGGFAQACAGVVHACAVSSLAKASVRVKATSTARLTFARTQLAVWWRKPGTTRFITRPGTIADISTGSASIPLKRFVKGPGTWCVRARLAPGAGDLVGRSSLTRTCVSYFRTPVTG